MTRVNSQRDPWLTFGIVESGRRFSPSEEELVFRLNRSDVSNGTYRGVNMVMGAHQLE